MLTLLQQLVDKELEGVGRETRENFFRFSIRVLSSHLASTGDDIESLTQTLCQDLEEVGKARQVPRFELRKAMHDSRGDF